MITPYELHQSDNSDIVSTQYNITRYTKQLDDNPLLDGNYIEDIALSHTIQSRIEHKLDREPRGYIICDITGDYAMIRNDGWDNKYLYLTPNCSVPNNIVIKLWVF